MDDVTEKAAEILEELPDEADTTRDEVTERLKAYMGHDLSMATAADAVSREFGGGSGTMPDGEAEDRDIATLDTEGEPVNIEGEVIQLWEPKNKSINQTGLIGDESGVTKFTEFKSDDIAMDMEEGKSYRIEDATVDEWQGDYNFTFNGESTVTELDTSIEVGEREKETVLVSGPIVNVPDEKNGLVRRRVSDNRVVGSDSDEDTEYDLRLKVHLDDGDECHKVFFDADQTVEITGIDIDEAQEIASDSLAIKAVIDEMKSDVLGQYFELEVVQFDENNFVEEYERTAVSDPTAEADAILNDMEVNA